MASEVEIANMAALHVGVGVGITSLDDDRPIAQKLKAAWNVARRAAIRDGAWNFASRRTRLAAVVVSADDKYPWAYAYQEPAECLRLIEVMGLRVGEPSDCYAYENKMILTNQAAPLPVRYAVDVEEPALWDALFAKAFAAQLAIDVGSSVAGSMFDRDKVMIEYRRLILASRRVDARENPPIDMAESDWITSRHGYGVRRGRGLGGGW